MDRKQAFRTARVLAAATDDCFLSGSLKHTFAVVLGTSLQALIFGRELELGELAVLLLDVCG